ncbi:MAG: LPS export ABC transporter periplasmic protein LptC [Betaproteobacteria bacterium RIFCSPLOWO2_12_FULL_63_13]|nr:MAG: LPS export ABC transporter periplasmic protein LptC [Betaproteobacteria bacterium RIFCSPLOWO2_02_FULL_63_19]OGA48823.1 MAG: LPS export ABC transporter periplasmic protein LptC [Betaproteobacteria bacterium RIFCSPLOWO2_12_FULL_63_13]
MKNRIPHLLPIVLMLFLAALTLWLRFALETPVPGGNGRDRHDPDAIIDNFTLTRLDEQGIARYALTANRMLHFSDDDTTEITAPRVVKRGEGPTLTITAERGTLAREGNEAFFHGNVLVVRAAAPGSEELRVHTDSLHVLPDENIAQTDEAVTITEGRSSLSGVGMLFDEDARRFALFSQVRGRFEQARK